MFVGYKILHSAIQKCNKTVMQTGPTGCVPSVLLGTPGVSCQNRLQSIPEVLCLTVFTLVLVTPIALKTLFNARKTAISRFDHI